MSRKYNRLTYDQKIEIIEYKQQYKYKKCSDLAKYFSNMYKLQISRRTINHSILNCDHVIMNTSKNNGSNKAPANLKFPELDTQLINYIDIMESKGVILNDNLIKNKALFFAEKLGLIDFKNSSGFLEKFKKRNRLKLKNLSGEIYTAKECDYSDFIKIVNEKINLYGKNNVYNLDETGLFYKLIPSKSVCKHRKHGYKQLKDRISIMLCSNFTGTHKLKPLIIGKYKNPRCFKPFNSKNFVEYIHSKKARMPHPVFDEWVRNFNRELISENRKILLLMDNCLAHKITSSLSNIEIIFLPKNSKGILQPMDIGIIKSFEIYFTQYKLNSIIEQVENGADVYESY
ncbi:Tigger transposable element-derived protein 6, partial [Dictyocoela muelleri]